jgi:hypothetical protein
MKRETSTCTRDVKNTSASKKATAGASRVLHAYTCADLRETSVD